MGHDEEYRQRQIDFVSGHSGTTITEVCIAGFYPIANSLFIQSLFLLKIRLGFTGEFLLFVLPHVIVMCYPPLAMILSIMFILFAIVLQLVLKEGFTFNESQLSVRRPAFISNLRAMIVMQTIIAILAVDFPIFPRRYVKTESLGISVMDIGVGSFVFSNAIVSGKKSWTAILPLFVLGGFRFLSVKAVDYQEHVSEYGVHWNFFFTLASLFLLVSLAFRFVPLVLYPFLGIIILVGYQVVLHNGLFEYVESAPRMGLISANKEGLSSLVGFFGIYLVSVYFGRMFLRNKDGWKKFLLKYAIIDLFLFAAAILSHEYIQLPSRKVANLTYGLWILAAGLFSLIAYSLLNGMQQGTISIQNSFSKNQLALFLIANVGTGVVNLSMKTLDASTEIGFAVVILYTLTISLVAHLGRHKRLVFW